jgi:hypothetical protein
MPIALSTGHVTPLHRTIGIIYHKIENLLLIQIFAVATVAKQRIRDVTARTRPQTRIAKAETGEERCNELAADT